MFIKVSSFPSSMLFEFVISGITLCVLGIASWTDIKTREVPDWVDYGLLFAAFGIRTIFSFSEGWNILISGIIGFIICFGVACFLYYTHQWGGGDSKLLMGIGAVIGITYPFNSTSFTLVWFFIALLFIGAVYGLIWMFGIALQNWHIFSTKFVQKTQKQKFLQYILLGISLIFCSVLFFVPIVWFIIFFPLGIFYTFIFVTVIEENLFVKKISVKDVTEGDWLAKDVFIDEKKVQLRKTLEKSDVEKLHGFYDKGKIKSITIKIGIPFIPSFLFAYLVVVFGHSIFTLVGSFILF